MYMIRVPRVYTSVYDGRYVGVLRVSGEPQDVLGPTEGMYTCERMCHARYRSVRSFYASLRRTQGSTEDCIG